MALRDQIRVMIVDDMSTSRGLLTQALDQLGVQHVSTAADGPEALRSLGEYPVHLVISDYRMPEMDGLRLLDCLRRETHSKNVGFILVTGWADPEVIRCGIASGMNNYLQKPFTPASLRNCIEAVVGRL